MMPKISFYVGTKQSDELTSRYGEHLEEMAFDSLLTFRAVLDFYTLLYQEDDKSDSPETLFQRATKAITPDWKEKDEEAYNYCRNFCLEEVDGSYVAIPYLNPMIKALTDAIQCHHDY